MLQSLPKHSLSILTALHTICVFTTPSYFSSPDLSSEIHTSIYIQLNFWHIPIHVSYSGILYLPSQNLPIAPLTLLWQICFISANDPISHSIVQSSFSIPSFILPLSPILPLRYLLRYLFISHHPHYINPTQPIITFA